MENKQDNNQNNLNKQENFDEPNNKVDKNNVFSKIFSEKSNDIKEDKNIENNNKKTEEENALKKLEEENRKNKDDLLRVLAELENTRKRFLDENDKTSKYAISKFAEDLIPVMENFYMAFDNMKEEELNDQKKVKNFFDGIKLTQNELNSVFKKHGLTRLFPLNEKFDPNLHNAIMQEETSEMEEGQITKVMQAGYKIKDRLLRPALVAVAKAKN